MISSSLGHLNRIRRRYYSIIVRSLFFCSVFLRDVRDLVGYQYYPYTANNHHGLPPRRRTRTRTYVGTHDRRDMVIVVVGSNAIRRRTDGRIECQNVRSRFRRLITTYHYGLYCILYPYDARTQYGDAYHTRFNIVFIRNARALSVRDQQLYTRPD